MNNLIIQLSAFKSKIIFLSVSILAIHCLYLIHTLGVNIPQSDELDFIPFVKTFLDGGTWWKDSHFLQHYDHRLIIPSLILLASVALSDWNITYQMYLGWSFILVSLVVIYALLKKTDSRLTWLMIPIAAIMFNAGQYGAFLWGLASIIFFLTSVTVFLIVYFINKINNNKTALIFSILFAIVASFTQFYGLLVWVMGIFGLLYLDKMKKTSFLVWVSSGIVVISLYYTNYVSNSWKGIQFSTLFTYDGLEYVLLFLSNGLVTHLRQLMPLQIMISIGMILLIIGTPIYFKFKKLETKKIMPWIQLGLFGLFAAVVTELGRFGVVGPVASRYMAIAAIPQIAVVVIGTIVFLHLYDHLTNSRKKLFVKIFFSILILIMILGISSSYYSGWKNGYDWLHQNALSYKCLRNPDFDLKCRDIFSTETQYNNLKILRELQLSTFADKITLDTDSKDPLLKDSNWKNIAYDGEGYGSIDYIDSKLTNFKPLTPQIYVNRATSPIDIGGWGTFAKKDIDVDSVYVFVDNQINTKAYYGYLHQDYTIYGEKTKPSFFSGWGGVININKLSDGCHDISIRITHDKKYYEIATDSQICIN